MVVNEKGEIVESKMRGTRLMSEEDIDEYTGIWTVIIRGITKQLEKYLGTHLFYSLGYERLTVHGVQAGNRTIVITARKDMPLEIVLSLKKTAEA